MTKQETHHNSPDQVLGYLRAALEVVDELEPPEDLRAVVFTAAVNLVSSKSIQLQPAGGVALPGPLIGGMG